MQLAHDVLHSKRMRTDVGRVDPDANALDRDQFANVLARLALHAAPPDAGQQKGDSTSLQRECSARARSGKKHPRFESAPRDDRSSKNQPKRVENGRDRSL